MIYGYIHTLWEPNVPPDIRQDALDFIYTMFGDRKGMSLELCCDVLGARADVLRLRVNFELWLRDLPLEQPLGAQLVPFPEILDANVAYVTSDFEDGRLGQAIAMVAWRWPGIAQNTLFERAAQVAGYNPFLSAEEHAELLVEPLEVMEQYNIMSCGARSGGWYLTGKNPINFALHRGSGRGGSYSWSEAF